MLETVESAENMQCYQIHIHAETTWNLLLDACLSL